MHVSFDIPDELANRINSAGELARRALEAFAVEEYRVGRITLPEMRKLLGFGTRDALDGFLKVHGVYSAYSVQDLDRDIEDIKRAGF